MKKQAIVPSALLAAAVMVPSHEAQAFPSQVEIGGYTYYCQYGCSVDWEDGYWHVSDCCGGYVHIFL